MAQVPPIYACPISSKLQSLIGPVLLVKPSMYANLEKVLCMCVGVITFALL